MVPGAVTGALPPLIGWVAAGGGVWDKPIIFLEFLFFTGQIPHFWLLILKYGEEYEKAGLPSLTNIMSRTQINRLTFTWVVTSVIAALFLCYFEIIHSRTDNWYSADRIGISYLAVFRINKTLRKQEQLQEIFQYSLILTFCWCLSC